APDSLQVAGSVTDLGELWFADTNLPESRAAFERALEIVTPIAPKSLQMARVCQGLSRVALAEGKLQEAEQRALQAWDLARQQMAAASGETRLALSASTEQYAEGLVQVELALGRKLQLAGESEQATKKVQQAFRTLEEGRAQALQRLMAERQLLLKL